MADPPDVIGQLVNRFDRNLAAYKSPQYNETELRVEFVNPFWSALGWDMENKAGHAMAYRDVIHEDAVKVGTATKAPDYCFRIGGARKFFLETKRPARDLKADPAPAYQLRRYGWSAKLPLSVLTDFEETIVYDCRMRPHKADKASQARILCVHFKDYPAKWEELSSIFSHEAVLKGSFDRYVESVGGKRGTAEVDTEFLNEIEGWRDALARNIALRNPRLTDRELNFAVQMTIDRIIFLRMCEDRGIEPYGRLQALCGGPRIYPRLVQIYRKADERYNSGLFHFEQEKDRTSPPDELTPRLAIDDKVLKDILSGLYYPDSPYEFRILPPEILGNVYEQFLGKVIRLTAGHQAKVEEKPEVRKAGGVYYTPSYIVDYIVKNTVGRLLDLSTPSPSGEDGGALKGRFLDGAAIPSPSGEGKGEGSAKSQTPAQVSALRILDPACGSGSFLLGAYQYLLDWHLKVYLTEKEKTGKIPTVLPEAGQRRRKSDLPVMYQGQGGDYLLTTVEKKRILLNNIYGVDIDPQAVEVTKLSLLLKVLETENQDSLRSQLTLWRERALPDLSGNIKCGNSLIGPDFYRNQQLPLLAEEDKYRINAFDWQAEFPEVFKAGGFDAVIGNPPYIRIQAMKEWAPVEVELYKQLYRSASAGNYDIYVVFVEKTLSLLSWKGRMGFILPHKFFNAQYGEALRGIIADGKHLAHVFHFGDQQVFAGATTYTCMMFLDKAGASECRFIKVDDLDSWKSGPEEAGPSMKGQLEGRAPSRPFFAEGQIPAKAITAAEWNFSVGRSAGLIGKLNSITTKLGDIADIYVGLQTSADDVFIMDYINETARDIRLKSKALSREYSFEKSLLFPLVSGTDVSRYRDLASRQFILFPYEVRDEKAALIPFNVLEKSFPKTASYLVENKERLAGRESGKFKGADWYKFGRGQNLGIQQRIKICVPRLVDELCAAYDFDATHFLDNVDVGGVTLKPECTQQGLPYILALLNSRLLRWFFPNVSAPFRGGWYSANRQFLSKLPIRTIDFSNKSDVAKHSRMVALVETMLDLHKKVPATKTPDEKTRLEREISATDRQLDALVYELYGLTAEEIKIVEEN